VQRTFWTLALCAMFSVTAMSPGEAVSQDRGRDRVCVYEHAGFGGFEQCFGLGEDIRDLGNLRNRISSVRVQGRAEITLFEHPDFQGREVTVTGGVSDMKQLGRFWNDEVDSLRVSAPGFRGGRPGREERRADRVCVYQHVGYQGNSQCFDAGDDVRDLRSLGWNDGISSIRTFGRSRAAFFEDSEFQGQRLIVDGDIPDLTHVNTGGRGHWNDRISSLRVGGDRWDRDRDRR
jgi:hypothetical protein